MNPLYSYLPPVLSKEDLKRIHHYSLTSGAPYSHELCRMSDLMHEQHNEPPATYKRFWLAMIPSSIILIALLLFMSCYWHNM